MTEMIADAMRRSWTDILDGFGAILPRIIAMLSILIAGWLVAALLAFATRLVLRWLRAGTVADRVGLSGMLRRAELPAVEAVAGSLVFWVVFLGFLLSGLSALGFSGMENVTSDFMAFIPRLAVGIVILVVGFLVANFAWRATLLAAVNANLPSARLVSMLVRFLLSLLTIAMALEQIGVARGVVLTAFSIAFGAVMLGLAIAFGIGGGDVARRVLERQFPERPAPEPDAISHV